MGQTEFDVGGLADTMGRGDSFSGGVMMSLGLAAALLGAFLLGGAVGAFVMLLCTFWEHL